MQKPNIVFLLSDDHAVRAISALGSVINQTPHLDRIAREGGVFQNSFCCNSICSPSRASILTGKHSQQHGVMKLEEMFDPTQTTFPKLLRANGYQTALLGKWHLGCEPADFDFWRVLPGQGNYVDPEYLTPDGEVKIKGYVDDLSTDMFLDWVREGRDKTKPFLGCCHFKAPHRCWMPPERYYHLFDDVTFPVPDNLIDDYSARSSVLKDNEMEIARHFNWNADLKINDPGVNKDRLWMAPDNWSENLDRLNPEQTEKFDHAYAARRGFIKNNRLSDEAFARWVYQVYLTDYLRCVQAIDDNVGRVLDMLDEEGLADNTIVVYCSDQGFYLGEHGWFDKRWMFEESMRMPLLMRWPKTIQPGSVYQELVQNIDYAPTLLQAAGVNVPGEMHGKPLQGIINGKGENHEVLYYHYYDAGGHGVPAHDGVRNHRYKLIHFYANGDWNLFDLEKDSTEMTSVHDHRDYRAVFDEMKNHYHEARRKWEISQ